MRNHKGENVIPVDFRRNGCCPHCGGVVEIEGNDAYTNFLPSLYWWCDACRRAVDPVRDESSRVQHEEGGLCM